VSLDAAPGADSDSAARADVADARAAADATPGDATDATASNDASPLVLLRTYFNGQHDYMLVVAGTASESTAKAMGFAYIRDEGCAWRAPIADFQRLDQYWSSSYMDYYATATGDGKSAALNGGYAFIESLGYVAPVENTAFGATEKLGTWWNPNNDNYGTAQPDAQAAMSSMGYLPARTEGYVRPATQCQ
jgi:hypothetical protein